VVAVVEAQGGLISPRSSGPRRDLIWLAGVSWDGIAGTDRHMATAMSAHARLLWVDPPVSPLTTSERQYGAARTAWPRLAEVADGITRLTPVGPPGLSRPGVRQAVPPLVRAQANWAARRLGIRPAAVVMSYLGDLLGGWGGEVVNVLYGTDDYVAGAELMGVPAGHLRARERRALASADVVLAVTLQLAEKWAALGAAATVLPNGCWPDDGPAPAPAAAAEGLPRPVVGLVGQLSDRIDITVLEAIASAGLSLLVVGPHDPRWEQARFTKLVSLPNVRYVGAVPVADVRSYLSAVDVGITPYRDTPFNRASFPLKTLEYFGAGLPVVSADLPAARSLLEDLTADTPDPQAGGILRLASGPEGFVAAISQLTGRAPALAGARPADAIPAAWRGWADDPAQRCVAFAARHSWPRRAHDLAAEIGLASAQSLPAVASNNPKRKG
jgi:teichuronic acid biosynthesis glycosyltransferase TuaH